MNNHMRLSAAAIIRGGKEHPHIRGEVRFYQRRDGVIVEARINGLPENGSGFYGFHIHEGNSCMGAGFPESGGHFNPLGMPHPKHAGDLPPLLSDHRRAYMKFFTDRFHIEEIIGRTVIIHSHPDDLTTQPSGDSGNKIACGIIHRQ